MRKTKALYRYYALRDTFCANKYEHCFTALRRIAQSYRKYYMKKLASPRAWCHFEIIMWSYLNGTILSDAHFFTPSKKKWRSHKWRFRVPPKSHFAVATLFKNVKTRMCAGGALPSLAGNKGSIVRSKLQFQNVTSETIVTHGIYSHFAKM